MNDTMAPFKDGGPAFPSQLVQVVPPKLVGQPPQQHVHYFFGMSKREVLAGLVASGAFHAGFIEVVPATIAMHSVRVADELLAELAKGDENGTANDTAGEGGTDGSRGADAS